MHRDPDPLTGAGRHAGYRKLLRFPEPRFHYPRSGKKKSYIPVLSWEFAEMKYSIHPY